MTVLTRDPTIEGESAAVSLAGLLVQLPGWYADARCLDADPDVFYPSKGKSAEPAKRLCRACPSRRRCLDEILRIEHGDSKATRAGIWGGLTPNERANLELLPAAAA